MLAIPGSEVRITNSLHQGYPPGVHVPPGVHLLILRGTFKVSNRREKYIYIPFLSKYLYIYQ